MNNVKITNGCSKKSDITIDLHYGDNGENGILLGNLFNENKTLNSNYCYKWLLPDNYKVSYAFRSCVEQYQANGFLSVPQSTGERGQSVDLPIYTSCSGPVEYVRLFKDGSIDD